MPPGGAKKCRIVIAAGVDIIDNEIVKQIVDDKGDIPVTGQAQTHLQIAYLPRRLPFIQILVIAGLYAPPGCRPITVVEACP